MPPPLPLSATSQLLHWTDSLPAPLPPATQPPPAGTLWLVYGLAISDLFIAVPNGVGAALGIVYCALFCVFPHKAAK